MAYEPTILQMWFCGLALCGKLACLRSLATESPESGLEVNQASRTAKAVLHAGFVAVGLSGSGTH